MSGWKSLNVGVIGGGIGGMSVAVALRRAGHTVTIYEKSDFAGEVGASVSCAANGTRWLHEWNVDIAKGDPVVLKKLINRDWHTGEPVSVYDLDDYEERWGYAYNMFHRQYMHAMLKDSALGEGEGVPAILKVNHRCRDIDLRTSTVVFENGEVVSHDLIVGADGIGSAVRGIIGITPEKRPSDQSCLHTNVRTEDAVRLGLVNYSENSALDFCRTTASSRARKETTRHKRGGAEDRPVEELLAPYPELDRQVFNHLKIGTEIKPWRLWVHDPYPYIQRGACMAIEDAAALGLLFGKRYFSGDIAQALAVYQEVRLPRVTRVQAAAAKAAYNINERIGFSVNKDIPTYKVEDTKKVLTIEEMNAYDMHKDIEEKLAAKRGATYTDKFLCGLPIGLELPNGITIGAVGA
ncbi:hypothetical protein N7530_009354 [Penicillium desertorum]|uniref:FAD-binding domain-containing protein n=1 Tax=Penicillium desertorum TaxID=1303715 RepID=A0A9X0BI67_9EURO|nr:hypothetical protein N7530_009354 [Penicillium desertorum]